MLFGGDWVIEIDQKQGKKIKKPDRRQYTFMIVPHHGQAVHSLRIPIQAIKWSGIMLLAGIIFVAGVFLNYHVAAQAAQMEKAELNKLRQVNGTQASQLEQLAAATAVLQEDMKRVNSLDAELRRMVNSDESNQTSRSSAGRITNGQSGQGGPTIKPSPDELLNLVADLQANAKAREQSLAELKQEIADKRARFAATPSIMPAEGDVTSRFGWRSSPWGWGGGDWQPGIDIANDTGTPLYAAADGVVIFSEWYSGYGKLVQIDHGNGIVTLYGHNSENLVRVGQTVKKGQHIANMGSTGNSTGSHVHYEVRVNGTAVNPASFL